MEAEREVDVALVEAEAVLARAEQFQSHFLRQSRSQQPLQVMTDLLTRRQLQRSQTVVL